MALMFFYEDRNFSGSEERIDANSDPFLLADLTKMGKGQIAFDDWNDEISSIKIISGKWQFFQDIDYGGLSVTLGPGNYPWMPDVGIEDNWISSIKLVER